MDRNEAGRSAEPKENGCGWGAAICAVGAVVADFMMLPLALGLSILAVILGAIGVTRQSGRGVAAFGLASGAVNLILLLFFARAVLGFLGT